MRRNCRPSTTTEHHDQNVAARRRVLFPAQRAAMQLAKSAARLRCGGSVSLQPGVAAGRAVQEGVRGGGLRQHRLVRVHDADLEGRPAAVAHRAQQQPRGQPRPQADLERRGACTRRRSVVARRVGGLKGR